MRTKTKHFRNTLAIILLILTVSAINTAAATFTVTNSNNTGADSLRQAVLDSNAAAGSDTIVFDPAVFSTPRTITLTTAIFVNPAAGDSLTITGPGASLLTVSGNSVTQIFYTGGLGTTAISGMTLTGGKGFNGGAIQNSGILTLTNVVLTANAADSKGGGGAIANLGGTLNVVNSTISNNSAILFYGGGIYNSEGTATINGSTVSNNTGNEGGGIYNDIFGTVTVNGSTISNNTARRGGGGIFNNLGTVMVNGSMISNNIATSSDGLGHSGGGILNIGIMNLTDTLVSGNQATTVANGGGGGGGISNAFRAQVTITNSTITGNSATRDGGGLQHEPNQITGSFLTITNSTVSNNTANSDSDTTGDGGGLFLDGAGLATISNSTVSNNTVMGIAGDGGGIHARGALDLINSTVSGNTAGRNYGGVFDQNSDGSTDIVNIISSTIVNNTATGDIGGYGVNASDVGQNSIRNTIVANNTAGGGTSPDINGPINSLGYNLFENTTGAIITGDATGNITGQDPNLGPLQDNGGPTLTHALLAGSPAIDRGNSFGLTTDQRGAPRPLNIPSIPNAADGADIGAFEVRVLSAATATISGRAMTRSGRGVSGAVVRLTDQNGSIRTARTNQLGYFRFVGVAVGETYTLSVFSKQYQFTPQVISVNENTTDLNFVAQ